MRRQVKRQCKSNYLRVGINFKSAQQKHRSFLKDKHKIPQSGNRFHGIKPKGHSSKRENYP